MEGFLFKKGRGETTFGRRNWKKRWFVLDGQYLTYYENFDLKIGKPVNKKGTFPMKGCDIKISDKTEAHPFCFAITHETQAPIFLDAENESVMKMWMNALKNSAMGIFGLSKRTDFTEYLTILGIPQGSELTSSLLTKSYRKISLKAHPDKGGDPAVYDKIQEAYNLLKNHLEDLELASLYDTVYFEVIVEKGGPGIGLGMLVVEDKKKAHIKLKSAQPNIIIRKIDDAAGGKLKPGDVLVGIDDDNTVSWTLARVVQRLNDFRVPIGSTVRLTYSRSVRKDGGDEENPDFDINTGSVPNSVTKSSNATPNFNAPPAPSNNTNSSTANGNNSTSNNNAKPQAKMNDIDGDYFASPAPERSAAAKQQDRQAARRESISRASVNNNTNNNQSSAPPIIIAPPNNNNNNGLSNHVVADGYISVVAYESMKSMNEELEQQLEACKNELKAEKRLSEQLKADVRLLIKRFKYLNSYYLCLYRWLRYPLHARN